MSKRKKPSTPVPEEVRKYPSKKDKRRWCKGKVGVEHDYEWQYNPRGWSNKELWSWDFRFTCRKCERREANSVFNDLVISIKNKILYTGDPANLVLVILNDKLKITKDNE